MWKEHLDKHEREGRGFDSEPRLICVQLHGLSVYAQVLYPDCDILPQSKHKHARWLRIFECEELFVSLCGSFDELLTRPGCNPAFTQK